MGKDTSKPISYKTVQKNKKLGDFAVEDKVEANSDEQMLVD